MAGGRVTGDEEGPTATGRDPLRRGNTAMGAGIGYRRGVEMPEYVGAAKER